LSEIKNTSVIELENVDDEEMNQLIDKTITEFDEGDLVTGTVVKIEHDEVLLDIGFKSEGVIPARELSIRKDLDPSEIVSIEDKIEALVLQKEDKDGRLILSKKRAEYERAWIDIEEKFNTGENVIGEVIEIVKGGLILDIGLRGFLPASLVDLRRVKDLDSFLGEQIEARVIEMDRNRNNVVLSRRVVLEEGRKNERSEILEKLAKGMRLRGTVSSIVEFGAFVDLGGIDGLVHISELSWSHVSHPSEVVKVGDEVEVEILLVELDRERISLGLKQTTEDPWRQQVKNFPIGSIIEGRVTKLVSFGAFVELGDGIEGLVHISEMAPRHIESPSQVVHVGDTVHVKVMEIDPERRRISLSMKSAAETLGIDIEVAEPDPNAMKPKQKPRKDRSEGGESSKSEDELSETPAEEESTDEVSGEDTLAEEAGAEDAVEAEPAIADESTAEVSEGAPAEEAPSEPVEDTESSDETETEAEAAVEEAPVEETLAEETPAEEKPAEDAVAEPEDEAVSSDEPAEETSGDEVSEEEAVAEDALAEEAPETEEVASTEDHD
jgi:small subunit ribosomal protein S1